MTPSSILNVIPTPRSVRRLRGEPTRFGPASPPRILLASNGKRAAHAATTLRDAFMRGCGLSGAMVFPAGLQEAGRRPGDIVLCGHADARIESLLPGHASTCTALNHDQGYVIRSGPPGPVVVYSRTDLGLVHAVATLAQLLVYGESTADLPNVHVQDFPDFPFRGNNWNLFAEIGGWSYERGDGSHEYERRIVRKLDMCAAYKTNVVVIDGVGWNPERFPGYGAMMRRLNYAARIRGIRLCYTGYNAGYGPPALRAAPQLRNRHSYPDGEIYPCCGSPHSERVDISRTMGTCLANPALLQAKQENLVEFIRKVEPGMLYLHGLDINRIKECEASWGMRCPLCRDRWPSDDLCAAEGMAGAYAHLYNELAEAVNAVVAPASGYDAGRDCLLCMVSPNYTDQGEPDHEWQAHLEYFGSLSRHMRHTNVMIGIREQFRNHGSATFRCRQLAKALQRPDGRTLLGVIHFFGGDVYHNNIPFLTAPLVNQCFSGADMVLHGNGDAYQEPQQLLNAEYSWNSRKSAFLNVAIPMKRDLFLEQYGRLRAGVAQAPELCEAGGFLDVACRALYGKDAGEHVAKVYRLKGRPLLGELSPTLVQSVPLLPTWNTLMPVGRFSTFTRNGITWRQDVSEERWKVIETLREACLEMVKLNHEAAALAEQATAECTEESDVGEDIAWLTSTLDEGAQLARCVAEYLRVFRDAHGAVTEAGNCADVEPEAVALLKQLDKLTATMREKRPNAPLDHFGGDVGHREKVLEHLGSELYSMVNTLRTGLWSPASQSVWW